MVGITDPRTMARGKCQGCDCDISSATAKYCVACFAKQTQHCPDCTDFGRLRWEYQRHEGPGGDKKCKRCDEEHAYSSEVRQKHCATCNDTRWVEREEEKA